MVKSRRIHLLFSLILMITLVSAFLMAQTAAFAADATPTPNSGSSTHAGTR